MTEQLPHCGQCLHYYVTYDPGKPYGCKAMGFKSRLNPARVVLANSGIVCQLFCAKKRQNPSDTKKTA